jgi:phage shock protein PspC (stress-responsive transcriptional regulator)
VQNPWHAGLRNSLGRYNGIRAVLFSIGGIAGGLGREWGLLLGAITLLWFMLQAATALVHARIIRQEKPL